MFSLLSLLSMFAYLLSMFLFDPERPVRSIYIYLYQLVQYESLVQTDVQSLQGWLEIKSGRLVIRVRVKYQKLDRDLDRYMYTENLIIYRSFIKCHFVYHIYFTSFLFVKLPRTGATQLNIVYFPSKSFRHFL